MKLKDGKSYNYLMHGCGRQHEKGTITDICLNGIDYGQQCYEATLCQLHQMFKLNGLPETITPYVFLRNAFGGGWQWIWENPKGEYISFSGDTSAGSGLGPGYDFNYLPTHITIANPYLNADGTIPDYAEAQSPGGFSGVFPLSDGVLIKTTSELMGLDQLARYFAGLEDTAATTLAIALVNSRMAVNWLAKTDDDKTALEAYLMQVVQGKPAVAITKEWQDEQGSLALGATAGSAALLKSQIEALQYVRGYKWQTFGVQSNHNMKREAINESEAGMNQNSLLPLIDDIFECLKAGLDECNRRFGWNASIEYASAWKEIQEVTEEVLPDVGNPETGADQSDGNNPAAGESVADGDGTGAADAVGAKERGEEN